MSGNIRNRFVLLCGMVVGIVLLVCPAGANAATGTGESPLFDLNTLWASGVGSESEMPQADRLGGSYPNPFNPLTTIKFELAGPTAVRLRVYDLQGHLVRRLLEGDVLEGGVHEAEWNGRDGSGGRVAAGVYLYRLVTNGYVGSRRMTLVK
jgi:hypothetical protein